MDNEEKTTSPQQICSIRIGFPVTSDQQAIDYKKKIGDILADTPGVRMEFSISSIPVRGNPVM